MNTDPLSVATNPPVRSSIGRRQRAYPLAFLLLLTAIVATLFAVVSPVVVELRDGRISRRDFAACSIGTGVGAGVVGAVIGLYHHRRRKGLLLGTFAGLMTGSIVGPTLLSRAHERIFVGSLSGVLVILAIGFLFHSGRGSVRSR